MAGGSGRIASAGASDKAQARRALEAQAGYHRERVNLSSIGIGVCGAALLVLGWLRMRSGSLLPGMLLHFLYNGMVITLLA